MKKTVMVNGVKQKVDLEITNHERTQNEVDKYGNKVAHGTHDFVINGKTYKVGYKSKLQKSGKVTTRYYVYGREFPDNHKAIIEFILEVDALIEFHKSKYNCPKCGGELDVEYGLCECGYFKGDGMGDIIADRAKDGE